MFLSEMENEDTYHIDFTTASELEIFIARLEEIIQDWHLPQKKVRRKLQANDFKTKEWRSTSEKITYAEVEFQLVRYYLDYNKDLDAMPEDESDLENNFAQAMNDMLSLENDFFPITIPPSKESHPIARWYGLRDFLVLIPKLSSLVTSESQIKLWLSSICIAISNTGCQVPFFIQGKEPWQCYYLGVCQSNGFHTDFEMIHLKRTPLHCKYLTGLLVLFKSKIDTGPPNSPVSISVSFTYTLSDWALSTWTQEPADIERLEGEEIDISELNKLPFGANFDPIQELYLNAIWPYLVENTVVDGESYSDLEPMQAPLWTASISTLDNASYILTDFFTEFVSLCHNTNTTHELLSNIEQVANVKSSEFHSSLNAITESKISALSKAVLGGEKNSRKLSKSSEQSEAPISPEMLMLLLYYMFPDADVESRSPYPSHYSGNSDASAKNEKMISFDPKLNGMKSAPYDSLPWRLALVMAHTIHSLGGVQAATYLWYEFTQELRYRWDKGILLPGLEPTFPDPRTCLLNQKLQLLNCCISTRINREKRARRPIEEDSDSDEEFYDCSSDTEPDFEDNKKRKAQQASCDKPTGRSARHGELRLLKTGEFLYIPKTQDPIPKTEDQLEQDAEVLLQLGTDAHGSELRARLMSASLLSDMEAFKAANPGCILADFIRWYSPRDWIQDEGFDDFEQPKGHLSNRMEIPGNTWLEVWDIAKPVPVKRQKRLFNDTRESEKILDFFEQQNPKGFIELLLPIISVCVIHKLIEESASDEVACVSEMVSKLIKKTERLQRSPSVVGERYQDVINDVSAIEALLVQASSLKRKFASLIEDDANESLDGLRKFINNLLQGVETDVPGGPRSKIRNVIRSYFAEASKIEQMKPDETSTLTEEKWNTISPFPSPSKKEMILRCLTKTGPQRLHAILKKNECRICGAFTKDDIFY